MRKRRLAVALTASVAIHAAFVLVVRVRARRTVAAPAAPPPEVAVEIDLAAPSQDSAPSAPPVTSGEPLRPAQRDAGAAKGGRGGKRTIPHRGLPAGEGPRDPSAPRDAAVADVTGVTDVPSTLRMRPEGPAAPDLGLSADRVARLEAEGSLSEVPGAARDAIERTHPSFDQRLDLLRRRDEGRATVAQGRANTYFFDVARDARAELARIKPEDAAEGARDGRPLARRIVDGYLGAVRAARAGRDAEHLAPTGAPLTSPDPHAPVEDVLAGYNTLMDIAMTAATHLSCDVCAVVEPGREPRVEVAKGSGQPRMDALALSVVTAAVGRRPVAPDVKASRACYTFDLLSTRVPPMPMVGCGFDETTASLSCYWPLKKMVKLKMRLDSVEPIAPKR